MNRQGFALALALLVSSSEAVWAQRTGRGGAASNLAEELASCVRAVAPNLARNGTQMTVRLYENGSLADAPAFRSGGSPLPPAQMHDAIGRLRRCFPLEGVQRFRYQYPEWQTLVISFGDAAETSPSSPAGPSDRSGGHYREPASSPDQTSASRVAHLTCEDLARIGRLTVASWATISRVPVLQLTYDELQELHFRSRACVRRPRIDLTSRIALMELEGNFEGLSIELKKREAEERIVAQRRREAEAADRLIEEATSQLRAIVSAQAAQDPEKECAPSREDVSRRFQSQLGQQLIGRLLSTSLWGEFARDCDARMVRAQAAWRRAEDARQQAAIARLHSLVFEYAAKARDDHRGVIDQLGLPAEILDAPMNIKLAGPEALFLFELDTRRITVGQWLSMILSAKADTKIGGLRDRSRGLYGFSIKEPGQRTMGFYLQQDGGDVFVSHFQVGDSATDVQSEDGSTMISILVLAKSGISQFVMGRAPARQ